MQLSDVRDLFPEFSSQLELREFLTRISGDFLAEAAPPVDQTGLLIPLGALALDAVPGEPGSFDAFARSFCEQQRLALLVEFATSPLTAGRAEQLTDEFLTWLTERVQRAAVRTLVVVLDLLRKADALPGASSEERFWRFCVISATAEFRRTVLAVFPELDRQITTLAANGLNQVRTLLAATGDAIATGALPAAATGAAEPQVTSVTYGLGDTHAGGQTVCRLTFDGGSALIYKPRPMEIERSFAELVSRINVAVGADLPVLDVWCSGGRGWQGYADQTAPAAGPSYFRACGQLLAVLHFVRASDMHYENVLNHRGLPVVVDAESLFSVNQRTGDLTERSAEVEALAHTVFSTGFLPTRIADPTEETKSIDIGFLGYVPGQGAVTRSPVLEGFGTDQARVSFTGGIVDAPATRPAFARGIELEAICEGFAEVYDWAIDNAGELEQWLRELFGDVAIRSVLENTSKYYKLLQTASHPLFQQSTPLKELLFHRSGMGRLEHMTATVIRAEIRDLLQGDVPYFNLRTNTTSVYHRGQPIVDVLSDAPLTGTIAGIRALSVDGRDRNLRIIRGSYVDLTEPECDAPRYDWVTPPGSVRRSAVDAQSRQLVDSIAGELYRFAIDATGDGSPAWIGATIGDTTHEYPWRVEGLRDGLYAGVGGLAMFLAAAGVLVDDVRYRSLAERALRTRVETLLDDPVTRRGQLSGGMAGGYPGLAFAAVEAGRLTGSTELVELGGRLWAKLVDDLVEVTDTDFLMGSAGLLAASLTVGESGAPGADAVTEAAWKHLVAGTEFDPPDPDRRLYTGFAHGTSGTLSALARYTAATGRGADELARLTSVHEGLHNDGAGHWPISNQAPERSARGWCHGTSGVLLGACERLAAGGPPSAQRSSQIEYLAAGTNETGFGLNLSLCHGDVGNLMILDQAAGYDASGAIADRVAARRAELCLSILPSLLAARVGKSVVNDALYVGLAGIGHGLISLSGEVSVASALTFRREHRAAGR